MTERELQDVAMGRDRIAALHVLMPRISGILKFDGKVVMHGNSCSLQVVKGDFFFRLQPEHHAVYLGVHHRKFRNVFSARIYSDRSGNLLDGRLYVIGWERSSFGRTWQAELFSTYGRDSTWLLDVPTEVRTPAIVRALLSHIAAQTDGTKAGT